MSVGTPQYMSPEQATGERELDARSDLYALAAVLYEMLTGEPPHTGPNARAVVAKLMTAEPVPVGVLRPGLPTGVQQAITRALAKVPSDRFASASEFATALEGGGPVAAVGAGARLRRRAAVVTALTAVATITAVAIALRWYQNRAPALDPNLIAVFPFRMSGTDSGQASLRDGMVDLLETKFSGEGGPRVLPAQTAIAAWRRAKPASGEDPTVDGAAELARGLGAGSLVLGTVVATPGHLILRGTLLDANTGRIRAETKVEGVSDSVMGLVDALAARLVAMKAGLQHDRLATLTTTSLGALYAYLAGRAAHRAGDYRGALKQFDRAIELDSTFALAGVGFTLAANWADWQGRGRGLRVARAHKDRLSTRDRLIFAALAGGGSMRDEITAIRAAIDRVPDDPDLWTQLGDKYFHNGAMTGVAHPNDSAALALNRALALDTALNVEPMYHLLQIAEVERDTATIRRLLGRFPEKNEVRNLLAAAALGDSAMLALAKRNLDSAGWGGYMILMDAQLFGFGVREAEWSLPRWLATAKNRDDSLDHYGDAYIFYQHLGRPAAAAAALAKLGPIDKLPVDYFPLLLGYTMWGDGDTAVATRAATLLARAVNGKPPTDPRLLDDRYRGVCNLELWRLAHADTSTVRASMNRLEGGKAAGCDTMLRALLAAIAHAPDTSETLEAFEQQMARGHDRWYRNLVLARLHEERGDLVSALRAVRRRPGYSPNAAPSFALREEGRLAALVGDTAGAIRAYSHYLALRYNPEPSIKPEVDRVRAELARLVKEP
jgi:serine/threonine-protein kinase